MSRWSDEAEVRAIGQVAGESRYPPTQTSATSRPTGLLRHGCLGWPPCLKQSQCSPRALIPRPVARSSGSLTPKEARLSAPPVLGLPSSPRQHEEPQPRVQGGTRRRNPTSTPVNDPLCPLGVRRECRFWKNPKLGSALTWQPRILLLATPVKQRSSEEQPTPARRTSSWP